MTLLNPAALLFLLAIPLVVLLHLLKIRRRETVVSTILLWRESLRDQQATAPFRRLRPNLLLLLQILVIAALALALARPSRGVVTFGHERTILILDVSAGMGAEDAAGGRLAAAKGAALGLVDTLRTGQQALLIEAGMEPRIAVPFTEDRRALRQAIQALEVQDVPTSLREALRLARAQVRHGERPPIVHLYTDGAFETPAVPDLGGAALRWHLVGSRGRNVGITAFEVRKNYYGSYDYQIFLSLANFAGEPASFPLRIYIDKALVREETVSLGPEVKRSFVVPFTHPGGGVVRAEIAPEDDLAVDDRAFAVIPEPRKLKVLLVGPGNVFLEKALAADPLVEVETGTLDGLGKPGAYDIAVLDTVAPQAIPAGRYLLINALPGNVPLQPMGRVLDPQIIDWDRTHPVMRYLDLSKVLIQEAMKVRPLAGGRALVEGNLTPLVYALDEGNLKVVFVGFDLYRADLPLRVAFPLFLSNALRWLYPSRLEDAGLQIRPGQPLVAKVPGGAGEATVRDPAGRSHRVEVDREGRATFLGTSRAGIYAVSAGAWEQRYAANLLDEGESNTLPRARDLPQQAGRGEAAEASFRTRQELWSVLALLALLLLLAEGLVYWREAGGRWPAIPLGVRACVLLAILFALAGLKVGRPSDRLNVLFLLDGSDSVSLDNRLKAQRFIQEATRGLGRDDGAGLVVFGGEPTLEAPLGHEVLAEGPPPAAPDPRGTDIGAAIRLALAAFPGEGARRIVLLTDGNENRGSARDAARRARGEGAEIFAVPLNNDLGGEALLERMILPQEVKQGESFLLRVVAWSAKASEGRLSVYRDGGFLGSQRVRLQPGKNVFAYQQALDEEGFHVYQARIEAPDDVVAENNRAVGLVAVRGRPTVLYVEKDREQGRHVIEALKTQQIQAEMVGPEGLPRRLEGLLKYDALILSNVSALRVSKDQMEMVRDYVRDHGGGLLMLGGDESFGVGGYYHTAIEEALPVTMEARQKVEVPSLAVALVLDRSGSMETASQDSRFSKLELAKEASQLVVELLDERNEVGVAAFDTAWSWVVPMGPAKDKERIIRDIASIKAGGGTDLFPALKEAYQAIYDRDALLRHVIVLSDGMVQVADFPGLVRRMAKDKISVSAVAIGGDADIQLMTELAKWGRGRFYYTDDIYTIPRIFALETQLASKAAVIEQPFQPVLSHTTHDIVQDIDWRTAPPLGGYVAATPKATADTLLVSLQRDPILAAWRFGLGRAVAFTSDLKAKWGVLWLKWPEFPRVVSQMVRWSLRTGGRGDVVTNVALRDGRGEVTLEAVDQKGEFVNFLEARAGIVSPDKSQRVVDLQQVGPGRYRGVFEAAGEGAYLVGVAERKDEKMVGSEVASLVVPYSPEHRALAANEALLREVAGITGGRPLVDPAQVFKAGRRPGTIRVQAWPWFVGLALLLFVPDVALRRLPLGVWGGRRGRARGGSGPGAPAVGTPGGPPWGPPRGYPTPGEDGLHIARGKRRR